MVTTGKGKRKKWARSESPPGKEKADRGKDQFHQEAHASPWPTEAGRHRGKGGPATYFQFEASLREMQ